MQLSYARSVGAGKVTNFIPRIEFLGANCFLIESKSRAGELHAVDAGELTCTCEAHTLGNRGCWHIAFILDLIERSRVEYGEVKQY